MLQTAGVVLPDAVCGQVLLTCPKGLAVQYFDVFNGDADGLCALQQLRLAEPRQATLVTGVKRDIALLQRVPPTPDACVTVLDLSLDTNWIALGALLQCGARVEYFDHHFAGDIPVCAGLSSHVDTAGHVCTSVLVDRHLGGVHRRWAVVGAFGDNLEQTARQLGASLPLDARQTDLLRELGECLNYNAYADSEADLMIHPAALHRLLQPHADPFGVIDSEPVLRRIRDTRRDDLALAQGVRAYATAPCGTVFILPDEAWSRRVRGAWGNRLAHASPGQAHAILAPNGHGGYVVSVRAPVASLRGADHLCRAFPTGGGRAAAGGINHLPQQRLRDFIRAFEHAF